MLQSPADPRDCNIIESQNDLAWNMPYRSSLSNLPAMGRDTFHLTTLLKAPSSLTLNTSRERAATDPLCNLGQGLTALRVKNLFLISNLNLQSFSFKTLSLVSSLHALVKVPLQLSRRPLQVLEAATRFPWSILFSRLNSPNFLSLSSQQQGSTTLVVSVPSSGPTPTGPCLSCAEGSRAGRRTPRGSHQSGAEGQNPLPHPVPTLLGKQPRVWLAFWAANIFSCTGGYHLFSL